MAKRLSYDVEVGVSAAVMYRDFTTADYWQDLIAHYCEFGTDTEIRNFSCGDDGTDIAFAHTLRSADLPAIVRPVLPRTFVLTREQHFDPFEPATNTAAGHYRAVIPAPVDVTGDYLLSDTDNGSRMRLRARCTVRIPLIGGQIEQLLIGGLQQMFAGEGEFTADWIAGHR